VVLVVGLVYVLSGLLPRALLTSRAERRARALEKTHNEADGG